MKIVAQKQPEMAKCHAELCGELQRVQRSAEECGKACDADVRVVKAGGSQDAHDGQSSPFDAPEKLMHQ